MKNTGKISQVSVVAISTLLFSVCVYFIFGYLFNGWLDEWDFEKVLSVKSILLWPVPLLFAAGWMGLGAFLFVIFISLIVPLGIGYLITRLFTKLINKNL